MSKFNEIVKNALGEAKQRGDLYHTTSFEALKDILNTDKLISNRPIGISTSRSPNIDYLFGGGVTIVLDGNKISEKYKIFPFSYSGEDAREEIIQTNKNLPKHWKTPEHNNAFLQFLYDVNADENEFYEQGSILPNITNYIKEIRLDKEYYIPKYINEIKSIYSNKGKKCPPIVISRVGDYKKDVKYFNTDSKQSTFSKPLKLFNKKDINDLKNNFKQAGYNLSQNLDKADLEANFDYAGYDLPDEIN